MNDKLLDTLMAKASTDREWWEHAALDCATKGHYFTIMDRKWQEPYLSRFWLTTPVQRNDMDRNDGLVWESRNSVLLHYFHKADDAGALHDHPWPFSTCVLAGGYVEERASSDWFDGVINTLVPGLLRPQINMRLVGDTAKCDVHTPHRVATIEPDTWTLVMTGDKYDHEWGFYPEGKARVGWREYLNVAEVRS